MKKILLIGILNKNIQEMYDTLGRRFQVQICGEIPKHVEGIMDIVKPDMIIINVMELEDVETSIFDLIETRYRTVPVLVMGTKESCEKYSKYLGRSQFTEAIRPISKETLLTQCFALTSEKDHDSNLEEVAEEINLNISHEKKHILVVDDSSVTLRSIKAMLDTQYKVSVATSGEMAMKSMKRARPDLILLDYEMPGCDGRETFEMIKADEELRDIPVIFLTGVADKEHIAAVLCMNPAGYFLKPPVREKLLEAIEARV